MRNLIKEWAGWLDCDEQALVFGLAALAVSTVLATLLAAWTAGCVM